MAKALLLGTLVLWASTSTGVHLDTGDKDEKTGKPIIDSSTPKMEPAIVLAEHDDGTVDLRVLKVGGGDVEKLRVKEGEASPDRGTFVRMDAYKPHPHPKKKKGAAGKDASASA